MRTLSYTAVAVLTGLFLGSSLPAQADNDTRWGGAPGYRGHPALEAQSHPATYGVGDHSKQVGSDRWGSDNLFNVIIEPGVADASPAGKKACGSIVSNDNSELFGSVLLDAAGPGGQMFGTVTKRSIC